VSEAVTRNGELTTSSLADALLDEHRRGRSPHTLYVGSQELQLAGMRIVRGLDVFEELRVALARVEVDASLAPHEWELRQEDETEGHEAR
jgi:hypothetical protein